MRLSGVCHSYGASPSLHDVSLTVPAGAMVSLLGPSGCGKTTLLKIVGGYLSPTSGRVELNGRDVTALPPERRGLGMVFQNYALFPHLSARRNIAFGLEVRGVPRSETDARVERMLAAVGLTAAEAGRLPHELSGGQQQRVALARAMVIEPAALLLDEPLANLDRHLRESLRGELRSLQRSVGVAALLVTHDQEEALALSDLVGVMLEGRLLQIGTAEEVYHRPRCPFVARFLGDANIIDGALVRPERIVVGQASRPDDPGQSQAWRPDDPGQSQAWRPDDPGQSQAWRPDLHGHVISSAFLGASAMLEIQCGGLRLMARSSPLPIGTPVRLHIPVEAAWPIPEADP